MLPDWAPNAHPLIVHFPIAIFIVAVVVDAALLLARRSDRMSAALYGIAALGAVAAYLSGRAAVDGMIVPAHAVADVNSHSDWGLRTAWFIGIYAAVRLGLSFTFRSFKMVVRAPLFLISLVGVLFVAVTSDRGGRLVYEHGLGTSVAAVDMTEPPAQVNSGERLTGTWSWSPASGLATLIANASVYPADAWIGIEFVDGQEALVVRGPATLLVGDTTDGVQVDARISTAEAGRIMILHNAVDERTYHYVAVDEDLVASQGAVRSGTVSRMASGSYPDTGWHNVRVVAEGTHFHAYIDGTRVTHGHGAAAPPGRAGLRVESGELRVASLGVTLIE